MDPSRSSCREPKGRAAPIQDEKYFFDDGDCVFLAEGVIFKLHQCILSRDPESMFRHMFSIPQGLAQTTFFDPISLSDTSAEFRALCWVLYATPSEIDLQTATGADFTRLVNVAKMSHKYTLPAFEAWALEVILIQCQPPLNRLGTTCTLNELDSLMGLACLCEHTELLRAIETIWISRLTARKKLRWCDALAAGEKYNRRQFQATVYYELNKVVRRTAPDLERGFNSDFNLSNTQLLRLVSGHKMLRDFWELLRQDRLPRIPHICSTTVRGHQLHCRKAWSQIQWPSDSPDLITALESARDEAQEVSPLGSRCFAHHLDTIIEKFISTDMASYFLGPETPGDNSLIIQRKGTSRYSI
ncbi:hypothetical protein DFH07DRAFT_778455 [Mycena maculata]|uniref:BTB domain-containing protein n=1 Tax=Mycena maculata TaxID=230809 RepID=A0AAD7IF05_9AGAR|nr:hypothetical protein DFH07DRAFT_778455 [Mycena maculata]